jgi:anti-sigma B factor antagonist
MTTMTVTTTHVGNGCLLVVEGEVDCANADELCAVALEAFDDAAVHALVVDLAGLGFCDAAALGALVRMRNVSLELAKPLTLRSMSTAIARLLSLTELDEAFTIAPIENRSDPHAASLRLQTQSSSRTQGGNG